MVEWWVEGFFVCLFDEDDFVVCKLLMFVCFYIVFNMNLDGFCCGYLCINVKGINLNWEWDKVLLENFFEVFYIFEWI